MYLVDTNVLINLFEGEKSVIKRFQESNGLSVSVFNFTEFMYGIINKKNYQHIKNEIINNTQIYNYTIECAEKYLEIKQNLRTKGELIPEFDMLIASTAITNGLTLITYDKHFKCVPGLKVIILN